MKVKFRDGDEFVPVTVTPGPWSSSTLCGKCHQWVSASGTGDEPYRDPMDSHTCEAPAPRTYWLSFCDGDKPKGSQFLGCVVVDVTSEDVEAIMLDLLLMFPGHDCEHGPWIAAASRKCHRLGVNPGGEMASIRIDEHPNFATLGAMYPRNVLMTKADVEAIDTALGTDV